MSQSSASTITRTGSCRCKQVTFSVTGPRIFGLLCHCRACRLGTSAPLSHVIGVPSNSFTWTSGNELVKTVPLTTRFNGMYCGSCGCYLAQQGVEEPWSTFMGTMACCYDQMKEAFCPREEVKDEFFTPNMHINYENRVIDVKDDLPKYLDAPKEWNGSGKTAEQ